MQELELAVDRNDEQTIGLGDATCHLRQELGSCNPHGDADADSLEHVPTQVHRDLGRRAGDPAQPADVQERLVDGEPLPEKNGVVSSKTENIALLASLYASIRGLTTIACGHRARAWVSPIGVRTPYALAS